MVKTKVLIAEHDESLDDIINDFLEKEDINRSNLIDIKFDSIAINYSEDPEQINEQPYLSALIIYEK